MATTAKKVFIESSVLWAFVDRADAHHAAAVKIMETLAKLNYALFTSSQNVTETYTALNMEVGLVVAQEFLQAILGSSIEILFPQKADLITGLKMLKSNRDRQVSLKEILNVTLMQKRGVTQVATFTYWHNLLGTYVGNIAG